MIKVFTESMAATLARRLARCLVSDLPFGEALCEPKYHLQMRLVAAADFLYTRRMGRRIAGTLLCLAVSIGACGSDSTSSSTATDVSHVMAVGPGCECRLGTQFQNLALCVSPTTSFAASHVYSTSWDDVQGKAVCEPWRDPQPAPAAPWSKLQVSSACAGSGRLCVTVRAGDIAHVSPDDCTLGSDCSDIDYPIPNQQLELAPLAGWVAQSSDCALRREQLGAYLELTLSSAKLGCGMGLDQIERIPVCPTRCQDDPKGVGCEICGNGKTLTSL